MVRLIDYLKEECVLFLDPTSKEDVIEKLVDVVFAAKSLPDRELFFEALIDREKLVSTAIGMGVALPHTKLPVYQDFFVSVGILRAGLDWEAIDDSLVRIVFLIGGPEDRQTDYLQLLSSVTVAMRDEQLRKRLMTATSPQEVVTLLKGFKTFGYTDHE